MNRATRTRVAAVKPITLKITQIVKEWDMKKSRCMLALSGVKRLKKGQCLLAFNGRKNMARFVDSKGGIHTYYAPSGHRFDVDLIAIMVKDGLGIELGEKASPKVKSVRAA